MRTEEELKKTIKEQYKILEGGFPEHMKATAKIWISALEWVIEN